MRSLRSRLTAGLLIGTSLLLAAGGFVLHRVISSRLRRDYDAALLARARSLASLTEQKSGRVWLQFTDEVMPDFASKQSPDYFQIWLANGLVIERSRSLGTRDLARSGASFDKPVLSDVVLPDGRRGRQIEIRFHPLSEEEEDRLRDTEQSSGPSTSKDLTVTLAIAHGREELDTFLLSLQVTLVLVALGLLAATAVLVRVAIGVGLAPLDNLGLSLEAMGAESLGETLDSAGAPAELIPMIRHLNGLLARLNESFAREKSFSSNLAHELRTPLAELRAVAEVALKWPDDSSSGEEALEEVRAIGLQMESVVVNLLALARCEEKLSPFHALQASEVPVRELAASCWNAFASKAGDKGMKLHLDVPEGLIVLTDREKLALILSNLLSNAIAHGAPGCAVSCSATATGCEFALRVTNTTDALTQDDMPRIFDRFWRKDPSRSGGQHTGLGLALVAALCELLELRKTARLDGRLFEITLSGSIEGGRFNRSFMERSIGSPSHGWAAGGGPDLLAPRKERS
jgi:two-component system, OmpR family, heavy metal sensor histidine kinase CusS